MYSMGLKELKEDLFWTDKLKALQFNVMSFCTDLSEENSEGTYTIFALLLLHFLYGNIYYQVGSCNEDDFW